MGAPGGAGDRGLDRAPEGGGADPSDRILVSRQRGRFSDRSCGLWVGLLPDPVQLHRRALPGGDGRSQGGARARARGLHHGAAPGRAPGRQDAQAGRAHPRACGRCAPHDPGGMGACLGLEPPRGDHAALGHGRARAGGAKRHRRRTCAPDVDDARAARDDRARARQARGVQPRSLHRLQLLHALPARHQHPGMLFGL